MKEDIHWQKFVKIYIAKDVLSKILTRFKDTNYVIKHPSKKKKKIHNIFRIVIRQQRSLLEKKRQLMRIKIARHFPGVTGAGLSRYTVSPNFHKREHHGKKFKVCVPSNSHGKRRSVVVLQRYRDNSTKDRSQVRFIHEYYSFGEELYMQCNLKRAKLAQRHLEIHW